MFIMPVWLKNKIGLGNTDEDDDPGISADGDTSTLDTKTPQNDTAQSAASISETTQGAHVDSQDVSNATMSQDLTGQVVTPTMLPVEPPDTTGNNKRKYPDDTSMTNDPTTVVQDSSVVPDTDQLKETDSTSNEEPNASKKARLSEPENEAEAVEAMQIAEVVEDKTEANTVAEVVEEKEGSIAAKIPGDVDAVAEALAVEPLPATTGLQHQMVAESADVDPSKQKTENEPDAERSTDGAAAVGTEPIHDNAEDVQTQSIDQPPTGTVTLDGVEEMEAVVATIVTDDNNNKTLSRKRSASAEADSVYDEDDLTPLSALVKANKKNKKDATKKPAKPAKKEADEFSWDQMYERLSAFKEKNGHTRVPAVYPEDAALAKWAKAQRERFKVIFQPRPMVTNEIGDSMDVDLPMEKTGESTLPSSDTNGALVSAAGALDSAPETPDEEMVLFNRLQSLGFVWDEEEGTEQTALPKPDRPLRSSSGRIYENWDEMYARLIAYKERHGDCLVPKRCAEDPQLGTWVEVQRVLYNRDYRPVRAVAVSTPLSTTVSVQPTSPNDINNPVADSAATATEVAEAAAVAAAAVDAVAAEVQNSEGATMPVADAMEIDPKVVDAALAAGDKAQVDAGIKEAVEAAVAVATDGDMAQAAADAGLVIVSEQDVSEASGIALDSSGAATVVPARILTKERKDKLDALGFIWSPRSKRIGDHWDEMFAQLVEYKERHGDCLVPSRYEENVKLGKWVETQRYEYTKLMRTIEEEAAIEGGAKPSVTPDGKPRVFSARLSEDRIRRLESIGFEWKVKHKMKKYYDKQWDSMFEKLLKYKAENGDCLVPKRYPPDFKLGTWVHTQRIQHKKLMEGTIKREPEGWEDEGVVLQDPRSTGDVAGQSFETHDPTTALQGTLIKTEEGILTSEVGSCRSPVKAEEDCTEEADDEVYFRLTEDRKKRLEEIGFVWSVRDTAAPKKEGVTGLTRNSYDDQWDAMFERLRSYKERYGHCLVPKRCKEDQKLGTWVDTQRVQYKKLQRKLAVSGAPGSDVKQEAEADDTGDKRQSLAPMASPSGKPLVGRLTDERINRLEELGFVWSLRDDWQKHYQELIEYKKEFGHCNVPARYQKNRRLGIWVSAQRQQYKIMKQDADGGRPKKSAPLTDDRIQLLNNLGFTWTIRSRDSLGESWNQRFEELKKYKLAHGNCLVPSRYPENPELGVWVGTQRTQYRVYMKHKEEGKPLTGLATSMNDERIAMLEELGFVWALRASSDSVWRKRLNELQTFKLLHGHCNVPPKYKGNPRLAAWVEAQRASYPLFLEGKPSSLDRSKVAELNSMGFTWESGDDPSESVAPVIFPHSATASASSPAVGVPPPSITTDQGSGDTTAAGEALDAASGSALMLGDASASSAALPPASDPGGEEQGVGETTQGDADLTHGGMSTNVEVAGESGSEPMPQSLLPHNQGYPVVAADSPAPALSVTGTETTGLLVGTVTEQHAVVGGPEVGTFTGSTHAMDGADGVPGQSVFPSSNDFGVVHQPTTEPTVDVVVMPGAVDGGEFNVEGVEPQHLTAAEDAVGTEIKNNVGIPAPHPGAICGQMEGVSTMQVPDPIAEAAASVLEGADDTVKLEHVSQLLDDLPGEREAAI